MQWRKPLPGESSEQFTAFCAYRDQPAHDRAIEDVALLLSKFFVDVETWCEDYSWKKRALVYDKIQHERRRKRLESAREVRDNLADHLIAIGASMILASASRAEQLEHNPSAIKASDLAKITLAGRDFVTVGSAGSYEQQLADKLIAYATDEQLDQLGRLDREKAAILARISLSEGEYDKD